MNPYACAKHTAQKLISAGLRFAVAESCTGGQIAATATAVPGASSWFEGGFVTYSNESKKSLLGVKEKTLRAHGAVSAEVATEMVAGVLANTQADYAAAVTGIAGPGGGTAEKPVGLVYVAVQKRNEKPVVHKLNLQPGRKQIQEFVTEYVYQLLQKLPVK